MCGSRSKRRNTTRGEGGFREKRRRIFKFRRFLIQQIFFSNVNHMTDWWYVNYVLDFLQGYALICECWLVSQIFSSKNPYDSVFLNLLFKTSNLRYILYGGVNLSQKRRSTTEGEGGWTKYDKIRLGGRGGQKIAKIIRGRLWMAPRWFALKRPKRAKPFETFESC